MRILIVGKTSFVGQTVAAYFLKMDSEVQVDSISVRGEDWRQQDFSPYDAVVFTAALVHRPDITDPKEYEKINTILPYEFACYVKAQGVKRFVYLSTVSVYQAGRSLPKAFVIDGSTPLKPSSVYGQSKLAGEERLRTLEGEDFRVSVIRSTYVYGKDCRGHHIATQCRLTKLLLLMPKAFKDVPMGMVYCDNLAHLCWLIVNSDCSGTYMAQDKDPLSTYQIMRIIAREKGLKRPSVPCTGLFRLFSRLGPMRRIYGGVVYSEELSACPLGEYRLVSPEEGIKRSI